MIDYAELEILNEMVDAAEDLVTGVLRPEHVERLTDALRAAQPLVWEARARLAGAEAGRAARMLREARCQDGLWPSPPVDALWHSVTGGIDEWMDIDDRVRDRVASAYRAAFELSVRDARI